MCEREAVTVLEPIPGDGFLSYEMGGTASIASGSGRRAVAGSNDQREGEGCDNHRGAYLAINGLRRSAKMAYTLSMLFWYYLVLTLTPGDPARAAITSTTTTDRTPCRAISGSTPDFFASVGAISSWT